MRYTQEQMAQWDEYAVRETLKREGREEGREEGRKEGREEGRKEGREEGRKEGRAMVKEEIALKLLQSGRVTMREIASYTGLSEAAVRRVKKAMQVADKV
jgi:predicted transposase YdaD